MRRGRILVIAKTLPLHDRASGDYRLSRILEILANVHEVDFLSTTHTLHDPRTGKLDYLERDSLLPAGKREVLDGKYSEDLRRLGVHVLNQAEPQPFVVRSGDHFDIRPFLEAKRYDLVWVEFYYLAEKYADSIRRFQPQAHLLCDSVDLHFRRLARQCNHFEAQPDASRRKQSLARDRRHADHVREQELAAYRKCDSVVVVSEDDSTELTRLAPELPQLLIPNIHKIGRPAATPWAERSGAVFVGNFDHEPNLSAAYFLHRELLARLPREISLKIVGSNPPKQIRELSNPRFHVTGYVPNTAPYLASARVSVAPVLFGAGMNGKIGEAIAAGLPVLTTSLGALGMGLVHEQHCLVADRPEDFAQAVQRLHSDQALWHKLRAAATEHLFGLCSEQMLRERILGRIDALLPKPTLHVAPAPRNATALPVFSAPAFAKPPAKPLFSVVLLTHNAWPFTKLCLQSLAYAEKANPGMAEYLLVDNASTDSTQEAAARIPHLRVLKNSRNLGYAAGNNLGIGAARGQFVVLLNNDTIVPPHWLARLLPYLERIPKLGILGPSTNTESGQRLAGANYSSLEELFALNARLQAEQAGAWEKVAKVSGVCLLARKRVLEELGGLDPDFGLGYFEDDDLCLRAADRGLTVAWAKDVLVHHFGSASFGPRTKERAARIEEGMAKFAFKWGKRGLEHITKAHGETLLRPRRVRKGVFERRLFT